MESRNERKGEQEWKARREESRRQEKIMRVKEGEEGGLV